LAATAATKRATFGGEDKMANSSQLVNTTSIIKISRSNNQLVAMAYWH